MADPMLRLVRSGAWRLLPRTLTVIEYVGPKSGRPFELVVDSFAEEGGTRRVLVGGHERKRWWRSFRSPHAATLTNRGRRVEMIGELVAEDERARLIDLARRRGPMVRRVLSPDAPVVRFRPMA